MHISNILFTVIDEGNHDEQLETLHNVEMNAEVSMLMRFTVDSKEQVEGLDGSHNQDGSERNLIECSEEKGDEDFFYTRNMPKILRQGFVVSPNQVSTSTKPMIQHPFRLNSLSLCPPP